MDNDVSVAFETLNDDVFNQLMEDAPPQNTPNATQLQGATKPVTEAAKPVVEKPVTETPKPEDKPVVEKTQAQLDTEIDGASEEGATTTTTEAGIDEAAFFKAKALGLIERGIWQEFDGMEEFEWNEDNYGKLVEAQAEWKADEKYEERVGRTGDTGKAILEYVENGGNPNDIVDLFKASRRIENYDIKTPTGKESLVREYYTKVVGWTDAKTDKYVKSLVDSGDDRLTEEATEAKELMDKGIQEQIKQTQEAQKHQKAQQEQQAKAWESNITKTIKERQDFTDKEKREIHEALLNYNVKLQDGRIVNKFTVEFMKLQADPQRYLDLVRYVTNPDKYKEKVEKTVKTEEAKKNWEFIKGNASLSRSSSTSHSKLQEKPKNDLVIDYKKLIQQ